MELTSTLEPNRLRRTDQNLLMTKKTDEIGSNVKNVKMMITKNEQVKIETT